MRRWISRRLRRLADRIDPEEASLLSQLRFYYRDGVGVVVVGAQGVAPHDDPRGCPLWFQRGDYDLARLDD